MLLKASILVLFSAQAIFAQHAPWVLVETSEPGAPASLSGTATMQLNPFGLATQGKLEPQLVFHISAKNISEKDILLRVLRLDVIEPSQKDDDAPTSQLRFDDYFFGTEPFAAHAGDAIEMGGGPSQQPPPVRIEIELVFVQFTDGSTWGDPDEGKEALALRQAWLKELLDLVRIYQEKGSAEFVAALMKRNESPVTDQLTTLYQAHRDAEEVVKLLSQRMKNVESHLNAAQDGPYSESRNVKMRMEAF